MKLAAFIESLLSEGKVIVDSKLAPFAKDDLQASGELLKNYYQEDIIEMRGSAPPFSEKAAVWAAQYFYYAVHLTVIRDADEGIIKEKLLPFDEMIMPAEMYSADLILRYLPALFELAKGLAPADILVTTLEKTATDWPFSSVGIEISDFSYSEIIFSNTCLAYTYADRIIKHKDLKRAAHPVVHRYVREALGTHTSLWPDFKTLS